MTAGKEKRIGEAKDILVQLGLPQEQLNERTAICLLALSDLTENQAWRNAQHPMLGIRAILDFARGKFDRNYAENTRETVRDESIKPMVDAGMLRLNPDQPDRAVNSPKTCYQLDASLLPLLRSYRTRAWKAQLDLYRAGKETLKARNAKARALQLVPLRTVGLRLKLSAGAHSLLIRQIIEEFAPRFVPGGELVYVGDTRTKWGYFNEKLLAEVGVSLPQHGKMPDVILYFREKNWLVLIEAVASSGPVDGRRHRELSTLFRESKAGLVFVTAFPDRGEIMRKFLSVVAWETEVWCASDPTHLIHFNGVRFLGPYAQPGGRSQ